MKCAPFSIAVYLVLFLVSASSLNAEEQTLDEFKEYVRGKTNGRLSDNQLNRLAKMVDKNSDGKVSDAEFEERMAAFQKVMAEPDAPAEEAKPANPAIVEIPALTSSKDATVLLITGDKIATSWVPFAKWKTANGKLTKIVTVGQIERDYEADSIQEKIRLCVRKHIENHNTQWVVLGGDCLPNGKGLVPGGHTTFHSQEPKGIPTDIVYLSKTNWDADGDGKYGEFKDDREAISYPDGSVGLGRIPVRTQADVAAFTQKVIAYESKYPTDKFATQMIYTCTDSPAYPKVRNSWDSYLSKVWTGDMGRFFSQETPWDEEDKPGSYELSADNLVKLVNEKSTGKLHIHGHGHLPAWVLEKSQFTGRHVGLLENSGAYPLITTVSCNTGEYDSDKDPSIVEHLIRRPNGGSVAVVAPVRTGKPHFANRSDFRLMVTEGKLDGTTMTMTRYWTFGLGEGATTGQAMMKAKDAMAKDANDSASFHLCVCELNLLGDPTLDMRAKSPKTPKVKVETKSADKKLTVSVTTDAPGSTVCLWNGKDVYQVKSAEKSGAAEFTVPADAGQFSVTVSGKNLNSHVEKVNTP